MLSRAQQKATNLIQNVRNTSDRYFHTSFFSCIFMIPLIERVSVVCTWPDKRAHIFKEHARHPQWPMQNSSNTPVWRAPCAVQIKGEKTTQSLWVMNYQHKVKMSQWFTSVNWTLYEWRNQARKGWYLGHWVVLAFPINITWALFAKPVLLPSLSDSSSPCFHAFLFLLPSCFWTPS